MEANGQEQSPPRLPLKGIPPQEILLMNRWNRWVLIIAALGCALLALACGKKEETPQAKKPVTAKQVQQETRQALETLKAYTEQQKKEYQKKVADQLAAMKKKLEELKAKVDKATPEMKARLEKEMGEAKEDLDTLSKSLAEMKTATEKAWDDLKSNLNQIQEKWQQSEKSENKGK
jgi:Holliday junction resolvase RusA-like endonuclease